MNKKHYSIDCFKLKHLDLITMDELPLDKIMVEVFGYNNTWFNKLFLLRIVNKLESFALPELVLS